LAIDIELHRVIHGLSLICRRGPEHFLVPANSR
jgi:hypothetical protein